MGTTIRIKCIDQTLTYESTPTVASGGVNEDYVEFEFNTLWDGFSKVAVFYQNKGEIYYSLVSTDNIAVIPKEVIAKKGIMYLGVLGVKDNVTRTSQVLQYHIESGALDGFTPVEPSQDLYQQVLTLSQQIVEKGEQLIKAQNDYEALINSEFDKYKMQVPTIASDKATEIVNAKMGDYYKKTETYSNTEIDNKLGNYYKKNETYSNTEIDNKLSSKVDNTTLGNYYTKTETYSKTEIDSLTAAKEITLGTTWTEDSTNGYFTQIVSVTGIKSTDTPILDVVTSGTLENMQTQQAEWAKVVSATTGSGTITFYASEATTTSLTVQVKVV